MILVANVDSPGIKLKASVARVKLCSRGAGVRRDWLSHSMLVFPISMLQLNPNSCLAVVSYAL